MKSLKNDLPRPLFPVSALIVAAWFLFNPNITILDLLPDAVAYFLILYALRHLTSFVPYMQEAADAFRKLFYISLLKIPAFVLMATMATTRITITLFSLTFAVVELVFLFPAFRNLFEGLFYMGERFGCFAAIKAPSDGKKPEAVLLVTYVFLSAKAALSTLPDFFFLVEYDKLSGEGFTLTAAQYGFILAFAFVTALVFGIIWLTYMLPYLRALKNDQGVKSLSLPLCENPTKWENQRLQLSSPFFLFSIAAIFSIDIKIDDHILFPDYLAAVAFLALAVLFFIQIKKRALPSLVTAVLYLAAAITATALRRRFAAEFTEADIGRIEEATAAYRPYLITEILSSALFLTVFILLGICLVRFYHSAMPQATATLAVERRFCAEEKRAMRLQELLCLILAFLASALSVLDVILAQFTHKVPSQPGYGGNAIYIASAGSFWLLPLLFSLALAIAAGLISSGRVKKLYKAAELDRDDISSL